MGYMINMYLFIDLMYDKYVFIYWNRDSFEFVKKMFLNIKCGFFLLNLMKFVLLIWVEENRMFFVLVLVLFFGLLWN